MYTCLSIYVECTYMYMCVYKFRSLKVYTKMLIDVNVPMYMYICRCSIFKCITFLPASLNPYMYDPFLLQQSLYFYV